MGCFLGDTIYRIDSCNAKIVSDGHSDVEKFAWPGSGPVSITILKTAASCAAVGGGTIDLYYWGGTKWVLLNSYSMQTYSGYAYDTISWSSSVGPNWWKFVWGDCIKIFKTGDPGGYPCDKYVNMSLTALDPKTGSGIQGSILYLQPVNAALKSLSCTTGADGKCTISGICAGAGYNFVAQSPGYAKLSDYINFSVDTSLTWPTATTPPDINIPTISPDQLSKETTDRQAADTAEASARQAADNAETASRQAADTAAATDRASIWGKINGILSDVVKDTEAWGKGILDLEARIQTWISDQILELLLKKLMEGR